MIGEQDYSQETLKLYNIMLRIGENSKLGMQEFYDEYGQFIYNVANVYKKSGIQADEIVQEVLIKISNLSKKCPKYIENPKGWLYKITINFGNSLARKNRFHYSLKEEMVATKSDMEDFIERDSFEYMIRDLSLKEQEIIIQKLLVDLTFEEIAKAVHRPTSTVATIYYRAINKLKKEFGKNIEEFFKK